MSEKAARAARRAEKLKDAARAELEAMSKTELIGLLHSKGIIAQGENVALVQESDATRVMLESAYQEGRQTGESERTALERRWRGERERYKQVLTDTLADAFAVYAALSRLDHVAGQIEELARSGQPGVIRQRLKNDLSPHFSDRAKRARDEIITRTGNPAAFDPFMDYVATVENAIIAALAGDGGAALRGLMPRPKFEPNFGGRTEGMNPAREELAEWAERVKAETPGATWIDVGIKIAGELAANNHRTENEQWMFDRLFISDDQADERKNAGQGYFYLQRGKVPFLRKGQGDRLENFLGKLVSRKKSRTTTVVVRQDD